VTTPPPTLAGFEALNGESTRTAPVKFSGEAATDGCVPTGVTTTLSGSAENAFEVTETATANSIALEFFISSSQISSHCNGKLAT